MLQTIIKLKPEGKVENFLRAKVGEKKIIIAGKGGYRSVKLITLVAQAVGIQYYRYME